MLQGILDGGALRDFEARLLPTLRRVQTLDLIDVSHVKPDQSLELAVDDGVDCEHVRVLSDLCRVVWRQLHRRPLEKALVLRLDVQHGQANTHWAAQLLHGRCVVIFSLHRCIRLLNLHLVELTLQVEGEHADLDGVLVPDATRLRLLLIGRTAAALSHCVRCLATLDDLLLHQA